MIDLVWGNNDFGLKHIISRREEQKININKFLSDLTECINNGKFRKLNKKGNYEFMLNGKIAVVSPSLMGNKTIYLLTAFKTHSKK